MSVATVTKPSTNKATGSVRAARPASALPANNLPASNSPASASKDIAKKSGFLPGAIRLLNVLARFMISPFGIVAIACTLSVAVLVLAQTEFRLSVIEGSLWAGAIIAAGVGAAFFMHVAQRFNEIGKVLDHTRRQMAISARILSEALDHTEKLSRQSQIEPQQNGNVQFAANAESETSKAHLQGLANIARAQVILANKSETDIGVLSGLICDLADIVAEQERELAGLRGEASEARRLAQDAASIAKQVLVMPRVGTMETAAVERAVIDPVPVDRLLISKLETAFTDNGFSTSFQPVVTLPQRKVKLYELALMLKDDAPGRTGSMVRKAVAAAGLAVNYDIDLIQRSLQMIGHFRSRQKDITVLCELTGAVLVANPEFDQVISELRQQPGFAQSLVIGLNYEKYSALSIAEKDLLSFLSETGVKFALIGLTNMRLDPQALSAAGIRFITIDVVKLMDAVPTGLQGLDVHVADLSGLFARHKIELIVQNIASDRDLLDIIEMEIPLAQGKLLGDARPLNPALSESRTLEIQKPDQTLDLPAQVTPALSVSSSVTSIAQRQPLRNFLRRA